MAKRPGLLDSIDMKTGKGSAQDATPPKVVPMQSKSSAVMKPTTVKTSLYLPPKAHHKLKEIALAKGCKVHDLVIEGLNKVLAENGFPSVDEFGKS